MEPEHDETRETTETVEKPSHRHGLDPFSLAFGVMFAIVGLVFLGGFDASTLDVPGASAGLLGAVGVLLLAIGARRQKR